MNEIILAPCDVITKIKQNSSDMNEIILSPCDAGYVQSCTGLLMYLKKIFLIKKIILFFKIIKKITYKLKVIFRGARPVTASVGRSIIDYFYR
jgi:hypothetical protein